MTWEEFRLAQRLLNEEAWGSGTRSHQAREDSIFAASVAAARKYGQN